MILQICNHPFVLLLNHTVQSPLKLCLVIHNCWRWGYWLKGLILPYRTTAPLWKSSQIGSLNQWIFLLDIMAMVWTINVGTLFKFAKRGLRVCHWRHYEFESCGNWGWGVFFIDHLFLFSVWTSLRVFSVLLSLLCCCMYNIGILCHIMAFSRFLLYFCSKWLEWHCRLWETDLKESSLIIYNGRLIFLTDEYRKLWTTNSFPINEVLYR